MNVSRARRAVVLLSKSRSIYRNLALEDWLFRRYDLSDTDLLLIWCNQPAVVVGRHQNVFNECNVQYTNTMNIDVARRQSGGGTVYHPTNNANFSFLTSKKRYDRRRNLELVQYVLKEKFCAKTEISPRHDLLYNGLKISGSASKLSSSAAYHHFTLLCSVDPLLMHKTLQSSFEPFQTDGLFSYESHATPSVRSKVGWLAKVSPLISLHDVIDEVAKRFLSYYKEVEHKVLQDSTLNGIAYPGISETEVELRSWNWIYGSNPPFTLAKLNTDRTSKCLELTIEKGLVKMLRKNGSDLSKGPLIGSKFDLSIWTELFYGPTTSQAKIKKIV